MSDRTCLLAIVVVRVLSDDARRRHCSVAEDLTVLDPTGAAGFLQGGQETRSVLVSSDRPVSGVEHSERVPAGRYGTDNNIIY